MDDTAHGIISLLAARRRVWLVAVPGRGLRLLILLLLLTACGGTPSARCVPVSSEMLATIAGGITVTGGGALEAGQAVASADFEGVYFIAARITGPGMGADSVGVWASNSLDGQGMIYAVDGMAREFSDWAPRFSLTDNGVEDAQKCLSTR